MEQVLITIGTVIGLGLAAGAIIFVLAIINEAYSH